MSENKEHYGLGVIELIEMSNTEPHNQSIWEPTAELAFFDVPTKTFEHFDNNYRPQLFQKWRRHDGTTEWRPIPHLGIWKEE